MIFQHTSCIHIDNKQLQHFIVLVFGTTLQPHIQCINIPASMKAKLDELSYLLLGTSEYSWC